MADHMIFDTQQLEIVTENSAELAEQLIAIFLCSTPEQLTELKQALSVDDVKTSERIAHSVKSAAATIGGNQLREVALAAEMAGRAGNLTEMRQLYPELQKHFLALRDCLLEAGYSSNA